MVHLLFEKGPAILSFVKRNTNKLDLGTPSLLITSFKGLVGCFVSSARVERARQQISFQQTSELLTRLNTLIIGICTLQWTILKTQQILACGKPSRFIFIAAHSKSDRVHCCPFQNEAVCSSHVEAYGNFCRRSPLRCNWRKHLSFGTVPPICIRAARSSSTSTWT